MSRAYWESDSMSPAPHVLPLGATPRQQTTTELQLQVSINAALMKRLDALEAEMAELQTNLKNLQHMMPV